MNRVHVGPFGNIVLAFKKIAMCMYLRMRSQLHVCRRPIYASMDNHIIRDDYLNVSKLQSQ